MVFSSVVEFLQVQAWERSLAEYTGIKKESGFTRICKSFFSKNLLSSHVPIDKTFGDKNDILIYTENNQRGHKEASDKTSPELVQNVMCHIEKFPVIESDQCHKTSILKYLEKFSILNCSHQRCTSFTIMND